MTASARDVKKLPDPLMHWTWRLLVAATILSTIGYFSTPAVTPLMCKIYG